MTGWAAVGHHQGLQLAVDADGGIDILQLQIDDAFAVRFLLNCAVALMTATAEFQ